MTWRVAASLLTLRCQVDALYPDRSRASDGTIGDAAHAASVSDHNPDAGGVVRALDITHDPDHGCDIGALSDALAAARDPRISYLIANRLITGPEYGWAWCDYDGDDPHTNHLHLSVVADGRADDARPWNIGGGIMVDVELPGGYGDYLPDTAMAILTGKTPRLGYPTATGPSWDNEALDQHNLQAVEGRLTAEIRRALQIDYQQLAAALVEQLLARRPE